VLLPTEPGGKNNRGHLIEAFVYLQLNGKCLWRSERTAHHYRSFVFSLSAINSNTRLCCANNNKKRREQVSFLCCVGNIPKTRPQELVGKRKERSFKCFQS